jgi:hypothetical protein
VKEAGHGQELNLLLPRGWLEAGCRHRVTRKSFAMASGFFSEAVFVDVRILSSSSSSSGFSEEGADEGSY